MRALVLFTRDLRVHDHPALAEACRVADEVVPLFVLEPELLVRSANRARFLLQSLADLDASLQRRGGRLIVREGDPVARALSVAAAARCQTVFLSADVSARARARERGLETVLGQAGIELRVMPAHAVVEPGDVAPAGKRAYAVFTPYFRAWSEVDRRPMLPPPGAIRVPTDVASGPRPDPSAGRPDALDLPPGGETAGRKRLAAFVNGELSSYEQRRDDLAADATSRLSPYLRFGCLSASEVAKRARSASGGDAFVRQLAWRDFFLQLLAGDPTLAWRDMRARPRTASPVPRPVALEVWRAGRTGLPLVDAGMRQLLREGFVHNRARMVAASFLTRQLGVRWQEGARHFDRFLVDGDPASNAGNWQWVAGTGANPRPSRVLDPVRQARRYDPDGAYVRRYVRELADVRDGRIFAPWSDANLLAATDYPPPLVPVRAT